MASAPANKSTAGWSEHAELLSRAMTACMTALNAGNLDLGRLKANDVRYHATAIERWCEEAIAKAKAERRP